MSLMCVLEMYFEITEINLQLTRTSPFYKTIICTPVEIVLKKPFYLV